MALEPGSCLGHYDVTDLLGVGGMGQVWQATDTQLNRQVATKSRTPSRRPLAAWPGSGGWPRPSPGSPTPTLRGPTGSQKPEATRAFEQDSFGGSTITDRVTDRVAKETDASG